VLVGRHLWQRGNVVQPCCCRSLSLSFTGCGWTPQAVDRMTFSGIVGQAYAQYGQTVGNVELLPESTVGQTQPER